MDSVNFYGRVEESALQKALLSATLKSALGLILSFLGGIFFILGLICIAWGFIPYQRLKNLAMHPPKLTVTEETLIYSEGKNIMSFPLTDLKSLEYKDGEIVLHLKTYDHALPYFSKRTFDELSACISTL